MNRTGLLLAYLWICIAAVILTLASAVVPGMLGMGLSFRAEESFYVVPLAPFVALPFVLVAGVSWVGRPHARRAVLFLAWGALVLCFVSTFVEHAALYRLTPPLAAEDITFVEGTGLGYGPIAMLITGAAAVLLAVIAAVFDVRARPRDQLGRSLPAT